MSHASVKMREHGRQNQGFSPFAEDSSPESNNMVNPAPSSRCPRPLERVRNWLRRSLGDTKLGVHVLICVFAISSWADLNGMWSELPVLVLAAPESWDLPSYITIISQVANIGPLMFVVATFFTTTTHGKQRLEKYTSFLIIVSDVIAVILISFFWNHTSHLAGKERSTALLALNFVFALGDCTSSVSFYAFMSTIKTGYMATFFLGEGLSGMLPAFLALAQGVSTIDCISGTSSSNATYPNGTIYVKTNSFSFPKFGEPRFSAQTYFLIISGILVLSGISFIALNTLDYCKSEFVETSSTDCHKLDRAEPPSELKGVANRAYSSSASDGNVFGSDGKIENNKDSSKVKPSEMHPMNTPKELKTWKFASFIVIIFVLNMTLTSFLASIQSYSTLPYGLEPYHLATNLAQIANPLACFLTLFVMTSRLSIISILFLIGQAGVVFIIYLAGTSPTPPLHDSKDIGGFVTVAMWVVVTFLLIYVKVCVTAKVRESGRRALIWLGVSTQSGSLVGALTAFLLVNQYHVLKSAPYC